MGWSWDRYLPPGAFTRSPIRVIKNDSQRHWELPARICHGNASDPLDVVDVSEVTLETFMHGYQVFTDWVVPPLILLLCLAAFLTIMKK